jgi:hypothetical protein
MLDNFRVNLFWLVSPFVRKQGERAFIIEIIVKLGRVKRRGKCKAIYQSLMIPVLQMPLK